MLQCTTESLLTAVDRLLAEENTSDSYMALIQTETKLIHNSLIKSNILSVEEMKCVKKQFSTAKFPFGEDELESREVFLESLTNVPAERLHEINLRIEDYMRSLAMGSFEQRKAKTEYLDKKYTFEDEQATLETLKEEPVSESWTEADKAKDIRRHELTAENARIDVERAVIDLVSILREARRISESLQMFIKLKEEEECQE